MMFTISGNRTESTGDQKSAFTMYNQTLKLVKCICRPFIKCFSKDKMDIRLVLGILDIYRGY